MKKRLTTAVLTAILLAIIWSCTGCLEQDHTGEMTFEFKEIPQQERKEYICDFLQQSYDISCEIDGDVDKRFDGLFFLEKNFFA